jgi:hypothetical protein
MGWQSHEKDWLRAELFSRLEMAKLMMEVSNETRKVKGGCHDKHIDLDRPSGFAGGNATSHLADNWRSNPAF